MAEVAEEPRPARRNRFLLAQWVDLMEDDSFRRYWFMRLASHGATSALTYSLLVFTIRHSSSALATGILLLTMIVPSALLGAVAGVAVDRLPKGLMLLVGHGLRALLTFALISANDNLATLYLVALGFGVVTQFAVPAESAVLPQIVPTRRLIAANSFLNLGTLSSQLLGMLILAPVFLKTGHADIMLFIIIGLFAFSAVITTLIPQFHFVTSEGSHRITLRLVRREFAESWLRLSRDSTAFMGLILLVVTNTGTLIIATTLPKFSHQVLDIPPENIVFVLAPVGISVFLGLRSVEFLADRLNKLVVISVAFVLMAVSLIALGLVPGSADVLASLDPLALFSGGILNDQAARILVTILYANIYGFSLTMVLTMGRVLLNERIPMNMQGRVFAAQSVLANLVAIVPVGLAGLAADALGVEPVMVCAGVGALLAALWSHARGSRVMPLEQRPTVHDV